MTRGTKKPDMLPMWIANLTNIKLNKGWLIVTVIKHETKEKIIKKTYFGRGLPLYRYDLRFESGNRYDTFYVRARGRRDAVERIKEQYPNVIGIMEV